MSREKNVEVMSGWPMLPINILMYCALGFFIYRFAHFADDRYAPGLWVFVGGVALALFAIACILTSVGFFMLQPNQAAVLLLFGRYVGTARLEGLWWTNPFYLKRKISLRLRNLNGQKLKVNDNAGNPIEIAAVVVWNVEDTYAASFDVDDYTDYVETQSESAIRHLASAYPYDSWDDEEEVVTLRGDIDKVSQHLEAELQERLGRAGVRIAEARLSHLAYAPEIAEAMLRRQQAQAIIAARTKIVEGAVSMVQMALKHLSDEHIIELDDERKASMISNLLVVLCGETNAQPVINTGTLYS